MKEGPGKLSSSGFTIYQNRNILIFQFIKYILLTGSTIELQEIVNSPRGAPMAEEGSREIIETLKTNSALCLASDSSLADLARKARRLEFDKGEYIFNEGDASENCYMMGNGRVILSKTSISGKAFTFAVATRGMSLSAITSFKPRSRTFSALAVEKTTVIAIPSLMFKQWVLDNPDVTNTILTTMGDLLDGAYTRILDLISESVEQRVLNVLTVLSSRIGPNLPMTNNNIAEMTGTSRETAARIISRLQETGLLYKSRGQIKILNIQRLNELSKSPTFIV